MRIFKLNTDHQMFRTHLHVKVQMDIKKPVSFVNLYKVILGNYLL